MRPNLVHSDSKLCFPRLVHASRSPAFEFLMLFGSWEPKPLQTRVQVYPWSAQSAANTAIHGVCQQTCKKHGGVVNGGPDITVNYEVSGFREAAKRLKPCRKHCNLWCFRLAPLRGPSWSLRGPSWWGSPLSEPKQARTRRSVIEESNVLEHPPKLGKPSSWVHFGVTPDRA